MVLYCVHMRTWFGGRGSEHPDVATSLENYAVLLRKTGRHAEADELEDRAKAMRAKHAKENRRTDAGPSRNARMSAAG